MKSSQIIEQINELDRHRVLKKQYNAQMGGISSTIWMSKYRQEYIYYVLYKVLYVKFIV